MLEIECPQGFKSAKYTGKKWSSSRTAILMSTPAKRLPYFQNFVQFNYHILSYVKLSIPPGQNNFIRQSVTTTYLSIVRDYRDPVISLGANEIPLDCPRNMILLILFIIISSDHPYAPCYGPQEEEKPKLCSSRICNTAP